MSIHNSGHFVFCGHCKLIVAEPYKLIYPQILLLVMEYEVIIVGAGSAGMAAGIYAQRFGLKTLIIGKVVGGLLNDSHNVENYPGFPTIPGFDLMMKFKEHVDSLEIPIKEEWVQSAKKENDKFIVKTDKGEYSGKTLIIATGTKHRHLGVPREDELAGKGVSYCATCDAAFFKNVPVAIVGGGDSAAQAGALLAQHASRIYVLVRGEKMKAEPINVERLEKSEKVTILYNTQVSELVGENALTGIKLTRAYDGKESIEVEGLFVEIGADVQSELAIELGVKVNERKEIVIDVESQTSIEGLYAAGDCGDRKFKQAITGASEGVVAAFSAYDYIKRKDTGEGVEIRY